MEETRDPLLTVKDLLEMLGVSRDTFDKWRQTDRGPVAYRLPNGSLRFKLSDIEAWLEGLTVDDPETIRLKEIRELSSQGKRIPIRLYGPTVRGRR